MAAKEKKKEIKDNTVITAIYRVNLHCRQCACEIKRPLLRTQGVHSVDINVEKGEIKVKGIIVALKIRKQIEKWSKKKVELISPKIDVRKIAITEKKVAEIKRQISYTTTLKVHMHCSKCENDLQKKLLKHKGIHSVKTDTKAQTLTVHGTIESNKLLAYLRKKVHKHAEIISSKPDEKEKKEDDEEKEKEKVELLSTDVIEYKEKLKVEAQNKGGSTPYFIHYVYAPQLFSDENPNACSIV